jgi:glycosyltransferase involved in cell wall biosynthesis
LNNTKGKVLIAVNTAWNLVNFRAGLIRALINEGYEVVTVAPQDDYAPRLAELGCRFVPLPMDNKGTHPGRDLFLLGRFYWLLRRERPDVYLGYTVKPNVYGSLAAHAQCIPVINNVAGLGTVFTKGGWLNTLVRGFYRIALSQSYKVFFQNEADRQMFVSGGLVAEKVADRLPGSGVDLKKFTPLPLPGKSSVRFLLIARMLWDKGVGEYVEASRKIINTFPDTEFCLLGFLNVENPTAISHIQMDKWVSEGSVCYLGVSDDVREQIATADCVVLPSYYREGTPRCLLEASAMGKPVITTNTIGCRDVVDDGVNGFLCNPRDSVDLAEKMIQMIRLSPTDRDKMGASGRKKMEREFDERIVIDRYLKVIGEIVQN